MKLNVDFIYPIGSIYISTESTNPSVLFGGTWQQTCKSRCLMGAGTNIVNTDNTWGSMTAGDYGFTAGARVGEVYHLLTVSEMPSHNHMIIKPRWSTEAGANAVYGSNGTGLGSDYDSRGYQGGDQAHNNLPPIEVYYIWKRVA